MSGTILGIGPNSAMLRRAVLALSSAVFAGSPAPADAARPAPAAAPAPKAAPKAGASSGSTAAVPVAGPSRAPILFQPVQTPASLAALGQELARALCQAAREADIAAQPGPLPAHAAGSPRPDSDNVVVGRLEELVQSRVRLSLSFRGTTAQSVGDLEHLDDLVYAVFAQLRPRLALALGKDPSSEATLPALPPGPASGPPASSPPVPAGAPAVLAAAKPPASSPATAPGPSGVREARATVPAGKPAPGRGPIRTSEVRSPPERDRGSTPGRDATAPAGPQVASLDPAKGGRPEDRSPDRPGDKAGDKPGDKPGDKLGDKPVERRLPDAGLPEATPSGPTPGAVAEARPAPVSRPRLVVGLVGDPVSSVPPGFYGMSAVGQQTVLSYLSNRLRIPAVPGRMVGLVGGLEALGQSLRQGAHHTFMLRVDSLTVGPATNTPFGLGSATLSGRIHIVLLFDGRPLLDRSFMLPPTSFPTSEPPASVYSRALSAALDAVSPELMARLGPAP